MPLNSNSRYITRQWSAGADAEDDVTPSEGKVLLILPVRDDWESCAQLLTQVGTVFAERPEELHVLVVDDGSTEAPPDWSSVDRRAIASMRLLVLRRNLGHQRAIAVGLCHADAKLDFDSILLMDADGEDAPEDAVLLLDRAYELNGESIVFAARTKRSERLSFRIGYFVYRTLHKLLTGENTNVGNFSVVPRARVGALVTNPHLWSHYAASVLASTTPHTSIPTARRKRLDGISKMNSVSLVTHGLAAIAVFGETVGTRFFLFSIGVAGAVVLAVVTLLAYGYLGAEGSASWLGTVIVQVVSVGLMFFFLSVVFSLLVLNSRSRLDFLPARDYRYFVAGEELVFERIVQTGTRDRTGS